MDGHIPQEPMSIPQFTEEDCSLFARHQNPVRWNELPTGDQARFRDIRHRLGEISRRAAEMYPGITEVRSFTSILNPSGRSPRYYWSCIHPSEVANKSYGLQIALIIGSWGVEVCFCYGAGRSTGRDEAERVENEASMGASQERLRTLSPTFVSAMQKRLQGAWDLRRNWLQPAGTRDFASLEDWLEHATSSNGRAASISRNLTPADLRTNGDVASELFLNGVELFAPLLDAAYNPTTEDQTLVLATNATSRNASPAAELSGSKRVWVIAAGERGDQWPSFLRDGIAAIGWSALGDLSRYSSQEVVASELQRVYSLVHNPINDSRACYQFAHEMKPGDIVFAKRGRREVLGRGVISSDYRHQPERGDFANVRGVEWHSVGPVELGRALFPPKTLTDMSPYPKALELLDLATQSLRAVHAPELPLFTVEHALPGLFISRSEFEVMLGLAHRKKNIILAGPPGVGKSFVARKLAYTLLKAEDDSRLAMVQFHQSYSYEDFIQGYRPTLRDGIQRKNGIFYEFCQRAQTDPNRSYVFMVDEINRGNLSKIFGELMLLLETDKRGPRMAMPLTYSESPEEKFYVPENLYVLGMMNTADRSLAMVDYALRRRFGFVALKPQFEAPAFSDELAKSGAPVHLIRHIVERMVALNREISSDKDLGQGFEIGHSFFVPLLEGEQLNEEWLTVVIRSEIEPLLREYWFDAPEKAGRAVAKLRP